MPNRAPTANGIKRETPQWQYWAITVVVLLALTLVWLELEHRAQVKAADEAYRELSDRLPKSNTRDRE